MGRAGVTLRPARSRGARRERLDPGRRSRRRAAQVQHQDLGQLRVARRDRADRGREPRRPARHGARRRGRRAGTPPRRAISAATTAGARCSSPRTPRTRSTCSRSATRSTSASRRSSASCPRVSRSSAASTRRATSSIACRRLGVDFAIAIGLVLLTLIPLGLRASLVVMISIPLSLAIGLALLHFSGFSLNQLSIAGFVLALGTAGRRLDRRRGEHLALPARGLLARSRPRSPRPTRSRSR